MLRNINASIIIIISLRRGFHKWLLLCKSIFPLLHLMTVIFFFTMKDLMVQLQKSFLNGSMKIDFLMQFLVYGIMEKKCGEKTVRNN